MICKKCGTEVADNFRFCPECGFDMASAPAAEPAAEPVQEPVTTPVQEPAQNYAAPQNAPQGYYNAPQGAPQGNYYAPQGNPQWNNAPQGNWNQNPGYGMNGFAPAPVKKKKTGLIIGIVSAVAVVAAGAVAAIMILGGNGGGKAPVKEGAGVNGSVDEKITIAETPEEQIGVSVDKAIEQIAGDIGGIAKPEVPANGDATENGGATATTPAKAKDYNYAEYDVTLKTGEKFDDILELVCDMSGTDYRMVEEYISWLKSIGVGMDMTLDMNGMQLKADANLNGTKLVEADVIMSAMDDAMYIGVPSLNSTYFKVTSEMMGFSISELFDMMSQSKEMSKALTEKASKVLDEAKIASILGRYAKCAIGSFTNVETEKTAIKVGKVSQDATKYTVAINEEQAYNLINALLNEVKNDNELEEVIINFVDLANEFTAYAGVDEYIDADDIYDELMYGIDEMLEELSYVDTDDFSDEVVGEFIMYINEKGTIIGIEIVDSYTGETIISYKNPIDGANNALSLVISAEGNTVEITGNGTTKGGTYTATYTASVMGTEMLTVDYTESADKGSVTVKLSETVATMAADGESAIADLLSKIAIKLSWSGNNADNGSASLEFLYEGKLAIGAFIDVKADEVKNTIKAPNKYIDVMYADEEELMSFIEGCDFDSIVKNLKKAGVPSELTDLVETGLAQVTGMGAGYGYEEDFYMDDDYSFYY